MYIDFETGAAQSKVRDLEWDVTTGFGKRNLLGTRKIDLIADFAFGLGRDARLINNEYKLRFTEPWFLGIRMPMILTGTFQPALKDPVQAYTIQRWSVSGETIKNFGDEVRTRMGVEYQQVDISGVPVEEIPALKEAEGISVRRKAYLEFRMDSRDHIFIPTRGARITLSAEYFGGILGGDDSFTRYGASWSTYQIVWPGWISATRLESGLAEPFGKSTVVPIDERYLLGGANTVRGFAENSLGPIREDGTIGSDFYVLFNQEFRWKTLQVLNPLPVIGDLFRSVPLWQSIFLDVGNGFEGPTGFRFNRLAVSYGTGIQFVSPAGPIRIDYGRRINSEGITAGDRWHFTILYAF
jgi:outer membrane protein insertion porin family